MTTVLSAAAVSQRLALTSAAIAVLALILGFHAVGGCSKTGVEVNVFKLAVHSIPYCCYSPVPHMLAACVCRHNVVLASETHTKIFDDNGRGWPKAFLRLRPPYLCYCCLAMC